MKITSAILLFVFAQGFLFSACGTSSPTAVVQALSWRTVREEVRRDPSYVATLATYADVCIVRGVEYSKDFMFQHVSGYFCYSYMNSALLKPNTTITKRSCTNNTTNVTYPCFSDSDMENCDYDYNYTDSVAVSVLSKAFTSSEGINKWIKCAEEAMRCCENMEESVVHPGKGYCPKNWDGWTCWDKSPVQTTQHKPCEGYIYSGASPSCQHYSNKECTETGKWNEQSDYSTCSPNSMLRDRNLYHVILLSVSIAVSLPALIIFFSYRKLRITRVILHRNLVTAIVIRNAFTIVVKTLIILDALSDSENRKDVMVENSAWCRTVSFMDKLSNSAVYSCLLLEGIFLHRLIAAAFKGEPKMLYYYLAASGLAILPVAVWTVITAVYNDANCWAVDTTGYGYIVDGPRIFALVINTLLMLDIVRVLFTKLRSVNTVKSNHIRRMTRATILLIPLFGVQFLVTLVRPQTDDCDLEQVYYYIFYTMDGLQGTSVALLYCYLNKEVQVQLLRTYNLLIVRFYHLLGKEYEPKHHSTWAYSEHRPTSTTAVTADDLARTSATLPAKNSHARSSRPSHVGSVSDILAKQDRAQSSGTLPHKSTSSLEAK